MLHMLHTRSPGRGAGLLTTINEAFDRVAMHAVRRDAARGAGRGRRFAAPRRRHAVAVLERGLRSAHGRGGARLRSGRLHPRRLRRLFLEDVRRYREERLAGTGLTPLFPLWKTKSTSDLAREMIDGGLRACLTCVDPREARSGHSPAAPFDARCSRICRTASTRAARTASSTRSSGTVRCSHPMAVEVARA